jgi:predicted secreted protein
MDPRKTQMLNMVAPHWRNGEKTANRRIPICPGVRYLTGRGKSRMNPISAAAVYFIIWWTTLFAVLPFGIKTQAEAGQVIPGTHESAPARPRFLFIIGLTTLIATLVFAAFYWFAIVNGLRFDDLVRFLPDFMRPPAGK